MNNETQVLLLYLVYSKFHTLEYTLSSKSMQEVYSLLRPLYFSPGVIVPEYNFKLLGDHCHIHSNAHAACTRACAVLRLLFVIVCGRDVEVCPALSLKNQRQSVVSRTIFLRTQSTPRVLGIQGGAIALYGRRYCCRLGWRPSPSNKRRCIELMCDCCARAVNILHSLYSYKDTDEL